MEKWAQNDRVIDAVLAFVVTVDVVLVVWAFGVPELWFELFHLEPEPSSEAMVLLRRCGGNWAAFALFQGIALWYWKRQPVWLAVVAGIRLSDIFTDAVYALTAGDPTWLAQAGLPVMGLLNLLLGWFFLHAFFGQFGGDRA